MIPPAETICTVWPWIPSSIDCSIAPFFMVNDPLALPCAPRSMSTVPEPALTIASVMRLARAAASTDSPMPDPPAVLLGLLELEDEDEDDEVVEAAGEAGSELPQALSPRAAASPTAAIEVVFMRSPRWCGADERAHADPSTITARMPQSPPPVWGAGSVAGSRGGGAGTQAVASSSTSRLRVRL
jgi:hypothetical protein